MFDTKGKLKKASSYARYEYKSPVSYARSEYKYGERFLSGGNARASKYCIVYARCVKYSHSRLTQYS